MAGMRNVIRLTMGVAVLVVERVWDIRFLINVEVGLKKILSLFCSRWRQDIMLKLFKKLYIVLFNMAGKHNVDVRH
jgi:hypothetical protein